MRINKGFVGLLRKKYVADTDFNELQVIKVYFCKNVSFEQKKTNYFISLSFSGCCLFRKLHLEMLVKVADDCWLVHL